MDLALSVVSFFLALFSGLPSLLMPKSSMRGQQASVVAMTLSMTLGLTAVFLGPTPAVPMVFPWPALENSLIGLDALSRFFLCPVLLVGGLGSIYGLAYWPQTQHKGNGRKVSVFWGILVAGMILLVLAKHALALLLGWEMMALSAFFLVSTEDEKRETRKAAYVYLVAAHVGTLTLFALFVLWRLATGSYDLVPVSAQKLSVGAVNLLFGLSLLGFGLKAGIVPLHFWLPSAHANAPTHVSAILSGVVLKMGIYGLVRMSGLLPTAPPWGGLILTLGVVSALLGVVFALAQHDLKRLLAYHSVENIGIILMGLGLALLGRSTGHLEWEVLGLAGCLLHVWNHSLFKSLLFFGTGSVIHQTGTREIDQLGGLLGRMPWTGGLFLLGAVAICGLPPLNGFISEWLVYAGLFGSLAKTGSAGLGVALAVPILAAVGALAVACFVKVFSTVFLGLPRTEATHNSRESSPSLLVPMGILATLCVLIGIGPILLIPMLDEVIAPWSRLPTQAVPGLATVSSLGPLGAFSCVLLLAILGTVLVMRWRARKVMTWDCGYARPTARMQYTASSLAQTIVRLFDWVLRSKEHRPKLEGPFAAKAKWSSHVDELVLDRVLAPASRGVARWIAWFRRFQKGLAQLYITYILLALILMLATLVPLQELWGRLMAP